MSILLRSHLPDIDAPVCLVRCKAAARCWPVQRSACQPSLTDSWGSPPCLAARWLKSFLSTLTRVGRDSCMSAACSTSSTPAVVVTQGQIAAARLALSALQRGWEQMTDSHTAQVLRNQPSQAVTDFALRLVRSFVLVEQTAQPSDLSATLSALTSGQDAQTSETLQRLTALVHQPAQPAR